MWRTNQPSSRKRASAAWVGRAVCQSVTYLAALSAWRSGAGATTKPTRRLGSMLLENVPT
jgi:hypothetical protein